MARQWYYAIDGVAAGMGHPGYGSRLEEQLERLKGAGFTAMVSLSTAAPDVEAVARAGMTHLHVSVPDFGAPSFEDIDRIVGFIGSASREGGATVVHCNSGYGRTGTVLASCLVALEGLAPAEAMERIRQRRPGSIETDGQEAAVVGYSRWLKDRPPGA